MISLLFFLLLPNIVCLTLIAISKKKKIKKFVRKISMWIEYKYTKSQKFLKKIKTIILKISLCCSLIWNLFLNCNFLRITFKLKLAFFFILFFIHTFLFVKSGIDILFTDIKFLLYDYGYIETSSTVEPYSENPFIFLSDNQSDNNPIGGNDDSQNHINSLGAAEEGNQSDIQNVSDQSLKDYTLNHRSVCTHDFDIDDPRNLIALPNYIPLYNDAQPDFTPDCFKVNHDHPDFPRFIDENTISSTTVESDPFLNELRQMCQESEEDLGSDDPQTIQDKKNYEEACIVKQDKDIERRNNT